jgi:hypothetical protein
VEHFGEFPAEETLTDSDNSDVENVESCEEIIAGGDVGKFKVACRRN